jgi:hypothetical protein
MITIGAADFLLAGVTCQEGLDRLHRNGLRCPAKEINEFIEYREALLVP